MKKYLGFLIVIFSCLVHAMDNLPAGCMQLTIQDEVIHLSKDKAHVILFYNQSNNDIWLTHAESKEPASAAWSSPLSAGNWSALYNDNPNVELSCVESNPGHEQLISCANKLIACAWTAVKPPSNSHDIFWITENTTLNALVTYLGNHDYQLPG